MHQIIHGDCLERLRELSDNSVDMVLADLPYGTTACKWDTVIPFEPLWEELHRVAKPNAAMCMFGCEPFSSALRMSNIKRFKYDWIWKKNRPVGFVNAKLRPLGIHEIISVFSEGKTANGSVNMPYNPQGLIPVNRMVRSPSAPTNENSYSRPSHKKEFLQENGNYPRTILEFSKDDTRKHPTQKPVALLEYLIRTYTNEGDTVLDPTMGSGSTGVACVNIGRNFIGIEREAEYVKIAESRIASANP